MLNVIDKKKLTAVVLLDRSKAFDSIDHQILLAKLQDIGASRPAIEWFGSYLTSRYQYVRINTTLSLSYLLALAFHKGASLAHYSLTSMLTTSLPYQKIVHRSKCFVDDAKLLISTPRSACGNIKDE